jgi:hypothetical protein
MPAADEKSRGEIFLAATVVSIMLGVYVLIGSFFIMLVSDRSSPLISVFRFLNPWALQAWGVRSVGANDLYGLASLMIPHLVYGWLWAAARIFGWKAKQAWWLIVSLHLLGYVILLVTE